MKRTVFSLAIIGGILWFSSYAFKVVNAHHLEGAADDQGSTIEELQTKVKSGASRIEGLQEEVDWFKGHTEQLKALVPPERMAGWLQTQANVHYNLAVGLYEAEDYDGAIRYYKETLRLNPDHADAHFHNGICVV